MVLSTGAALALAGISALGSIGASAAQMAYNKAEAQRNRNFQEHMRNTALESTINQATRLGISPSLVLGGGSNSLGGSQAAISGNKSAMAAGIGQFMDYLKHENYLKTIEEMNEDKIQSQQMINKNIQRMSNSVNSFQGRKYKEKDLNNLFDDIDKINF